jgi:phosphopantetheine adenylyltransferase
MGKIKGTQLKSKKNIETFTIGGKTYEIKMDFNVLAELEEVYGSIDQALTDLSNMKIKAIRALVYSIVKVEDETATLKGVGALLNQDFITEILVKVGNVLNNDMPEPKEVDEDKVGE